MRATQRDALYEACNVCFTTKHDPTEQILMKSDGENSN